MKTKCLLGILLLLFAVGCGDLTTSEARETLTFQSVYSDEWTYSVEYDPRVWQIHSVEEHWLSLIEETNCTIQFGAGGKGLMGSNLSIVEEENNIFRFVSNATGKTAYLQKEVKGDAPENMIIRLGLGTVENEERCEEAFYEVLGTLTPGEKEEVYEVVYPIENFPERVTLKPFGIYITPQTSPVQPERFQGYHTGADAETTESEQTEDVWIYSIAAGEVVLAREADGYGGVLAIQHEIEGESYVAIYGHMDVENLEVAVGDLVTVGQPLGVLGEGFSNETDGERKHLHFAIKSGTAVDLKGYVQSEEGLQEWIDPLTFLNDHGAISPI